MENTRKSIFFTELRYSNYNFTEIKLHGDKRKQRVICHSFKYQEKNIYIFFFKTIPLIFPVSFVHFIYLPGVSFRS